MLAIASGGVASKGSAINGATLSSFAENKTKTRWKVLGFSLIVVNGQSKCWLSKVECSVSRVQDFGLSLPPNPTTTKDREVPFDPLQMMSSLRTKKGSEVPYSRHFLPSQNSPCQKMSCAYKTVMEFQ